MKQQTPSIDIHPDHWAIVRDILQKNVPQYEVWAFGSRATWKAKEFSDLDLAIITDTALSLDVSASLSHDFSESNLPWKVDVVDWATTSEEFRKIIEHDKVVVQDGEDWETVRVGEIADSISVTHKRQKCKLVFLNTSDVFLGNILHQTYTEVSSWPGQAKKSICRNDILLSEIRPANGRWAFVNFEADDYVVSTKLMVIRAHEDRVLPRFLYHVLTSAQYVNWLQHLAESRSGTFPQITFDNVAELEIKLPPYSYQKAISEFLDSIDSRIELNRKQNETLEAMARTLFKAWFVDFEPVRAKMEGRWRRGDSLPGLPAHLYDLFPERLVDSELGEIPEGWQITALEDHVVVERGLSYKGDGLTKAGEGLPMHNLNSILEYGGYKYTGIKHYNGVYKEKHLAMAGDIIVANTEQGHHHRLIGFPAIIPSRYDSGLYSHHLYRVRLKLDSPVTNEWLYYCLMCDSAREQIIGCANGSTVNMLKADGLKIPRLVLPPHEMCKVFERFARTLRIKSEENIVQSNYLIQLRDILLPRLISGELHISNAEKYFEAYR